jgi:hypothetical protein
MVKRIAINVLIFLVGFPSAVLLLSNISYKNVPIWPYLNFNMELPGGQAHQMFLDLHSKKFTEADLLVIGSSHAYRGYDPRIFDSAGVKLFNMGTSGQSIKDTYFLLREKSANKNKIIIDIYPGTVTTITDESALNLIQNIDSLGAAINICAENKSLNSFNNLLSRMFCFRKIKIHLDTNYIYSGYVTTNAFYNRNKATLKSKNVFFLTFSIKEQLDKICNYAAVNDMCLVFVCHPLPYLKSNSNYYKSFGTTMNKYFETKNVPFFNYFDKLILDDTYFQDENHLNQKGVTYFNKLLCIDLKKINFIK